MSYSLQTFRLGLVLSLFLPASVLLAQEKYTHDGFLFRFLLGSGNAPMEIAEPVPVISGAEASKYETSSSSLFSTFQVGRAATKNFIIHFNSFYTNNPERELKLENGMNSSGVKLLQNSYSFGFGFGFSYYFPWNIYIAPEYRSAVFTRVEHKIEINASGAADSFSYQRGAMEGHGYGLTIGKEFWTSSDLGLGLALIYHSDTLSIRKFEYRGSADAPYEKVSAEGLGQSSSVKQSFMGFALSITYN